MTTSLSDLFGVEVSIDLKYCDPHTIKTEAMVKKFIIDICDFIGMKRYRDPLVVHFGKDPRVTGYSFCQLIEESNISGHLVESSNSAYLNIFSCSQFDPVKAANFCKKFFKAVNMEFIVNYRNI